MKSSKLIAALLVGMESLQIANAQNTLMFSKGVALSVKIIDENSSEICFNHWQDRDSAVYRVEKSDLKKICYQDGTVEIVNYDYDSASVSAMTFNERAAMGEADARKHYHNKGAGTGVLLTTIFLTPVGGIISAIACSSTDPKLNDKNFPSLLLKNDPNYMNGYLQQARKIKQKKVMKNFYIGFGVDFVLFGILAIGYANALSDFNLYQ